MSGETRPVGKRGPWRRVALWGALALVAALPVAGGLALWWAFFSPSLPWGPDMTGLEGVWREDRNPKHAYRFRRDGALLSKSEMLPLSGLVFGELGTWKRDGRKITVLPDRNWRMDGELMDDGTIRGKVTAVPEGNVLGEVVWRRE